MFTSVTSVLSTVKSQTDRLKESLNTPSVQLRKAQLIDLSSKVKSNVVEKSSWIQNSLAQKLQPHLLNDHDARQQKVNSGTSTSSARTSTPKNTKPTRLSAPPIQRRTAISTNVSNYLSSDMTNPFRSESSNLNIRNRNSPTAMRRLPIMPRNKTNTSSTDSVKESAGGRTLSSYFRPRAQIPIREVGDEDVNLNTIEDQRLLLPQTDLIHKRFRDKHKERRTVTLHGRNKSCLNKRSLEMDIKNNVGRMQETSSNSSSSENNEDDEEEENVMEKFCRVTSPATASQPNIGSSHRRVAYKPVNILNLIV